MRVIVDFDACQCMAMCAAAAPDVFEISDEGMLNVKTENPGEELREAVEQAVRECPMRAIVLQD